MSNLLIGKDKKNILIIIKIITISLIGLFWLSIVINYDYSRFANHKSYQLENSFNNTSRSDISIKKGIRQNFVAKGNILNSVKIYFNIPKACNGDVNIVITDNNDILFQKIININQIKQSDYITIEVGLKGVERGKEYGIEINSNVDGITVTTSTKSNDSAYGLLYDDGEEREATLISELQFTYEYVSFADIGIIVFNFIYLLCLLSVFIYGVVNIERVYASFMDGDKKRGLIPAIYSSISFIVYFNPIERMNVEVTKFNRTFGIGLINGYDTSKAISGFGKWFLVYVSLFIIAWMTFGYLFNKEEECEAHVYLQKFLNIGIVNLFLFCVCFFANNGIIFRVFDYTYAVTNILLLLCFFYCFSSIKKHVELSDLKAIILIGLSMGYSLVACANMDLNQGRLLLIMQAFCMLTLMLLACLPRVYLRIKKNLPYLAVISSAIPLATSLYIEMINVMNQHSLFVAHPRKYYIILTCFALALFIVICYASKLAIENVDKCLNIAYPVFLLGVAFISVQIPLEMEYQADIFESANYGILISDFLNYGNIPIVEHYGGHMMTGVWEGILYGIINNDYLGAVLSPYSAYLTPILIILFYFLLSYILDRDYAFFITLFFPFYSYWYYFGLGAIIIIAVIRFIKKNTYKSSTILCLSVVWCSLYRIDLGFAYAFASIGTVLIYGIHKRNMSYIKKMLITYVITGVLGCMLWIGICTIKGTDPILRLREFLAICASNQNHGNEGIGNTAYAIFSWSYIFIPFMALSIICGLVVCKGIIEKYELKRWVIMMMLGLSFLFNFPRALTRHSLAEWKTYVVMWSAYVFIAMFISVAYNKKELFLVVFAILIIIDTALLTKENFNANSIADNAAYELDKHIESWTTNRFSNDDDLRANETKTYWEKIKEEKRVAKRVTSSLEDETNMYKQVMDFLLEDGETYIDFMTRTFVYSAIGRRCPVYVSQSPIILSGEFTQERFIDEIEGNIDTIPLAIMPLEDNRLNVTYDNVPNAYRYYKVSEFIYKNYRPLCAFRDVAVWCKNDRYPEMIKKIESSEKNIASNVSLLRANNCEIKKNGEGMSVLSTGIDPFIFDIEKSVNLADYKDLGMYLQIQYESDTSGEMQLFYTTEVNEQFSADKLISKEIQKGNGEVIYRIPISTASRIRLDIPESSKVSIKQMVASSFCPSIDWGYDDAMKKYDEKDGFEKIEYNSQLHNYKLQKLPEIWAEMDLFKSSNNQVVSEVKEENGYYVIDNSNLINRDKGNYILFNASYAGSDSNELYKDGDEYGDASIILGKYKSGSFEELCRYNFKIHEGEHKYMIRISTDYHWYLGEIDAFMFVSDSDIYSENYMILQGD